MRAAALMLLSLFAGSCAELSPTPSRAAEACGPQPSYPVPSTEESERAFLPLQGCQRFDTFLRLKAVLEDEHTAHAAPAPEWQQHGFYVVRANHELLSISWAEGYSDWDETVDVPTPRAWWSCNVPAELTSDLDELHFSARPYWTLGLAGITLEDRAPLLQRRFEVAVDLRRRVVFRRSLAAVIVQRPAGGSAAPSVSADLATELDLVCRAERECGIDGRDGSFEAGAWMTAVSPSCAALLEAHTTPSDRAVGSWSLRAVDDHEWL